MTITNEQKDLLTEFCGFLSVDKRVPECGPDAGINKEAWGTLVNEFVSTTGEQPKDFEQRDEMNTARKEVLSFAETMESRLRRHDDSRGDSWKDSGADWLFDRLKEEVAELKLAVAGNYCDETLQARINEAADVANFAMFIAENAKNCLPNTEETE